MISSWPIFVVYFQTIYKFFIIHTHNSLSIVIIFSLLCSSRITKMTQASSAERTQHTHTHEFSFSFSFLCSFSFSMFCKLQSWTYLIAWNSAPPHILSLCCRLVFFLFESFRFCKRKEKLWSKTNKNVKRKNNCAVCALTFITSKLLGN